jgi:hypothetical protein
VTRGLLFLSDRQLPSGQFPVVVTFHYQEGSPSEQDEALFATTHIVHSLGFLPDPLARTMIARALGFGVTGTGRPSGTDAGSTHLSLPTLTIWRASQPC